MNMSVIEECELEQTLTLTRDDPGMVDERFGEFSD